VQCVENLDDLLPAVRKHVRILSGGTDKNPRPETTVTTETTGVHVAHGISGSVSASPGTTAIASSTSSRDTVSINTPNVTRSGHVTPITTDHSSHTRPRRHATPRHATPKQLTNHTNLSYVALHRGRLKRGRHPGSVCRRPDTTANSPELLHFRHIRYRPAGDTDGRASRRVDLGLLLVCWAPRRWCPQSDSNRHWTDFKSAASANWAMGAQR
jgi:hypothetical protein